MSARARVGTAIALGVAAVVAASAADAEEARAPYALEIGAFGGYDVLLQGKTSPAQETWARNGGGALAFSVSVRTPYVTPFVDVGYYPLYASQARVDLGSGLGTVTSTGTLASVGVLGGLGVDVWRLRLRGGIGAYDVAVRGAVLGKALTTHEADMGYLLALRGAVVRGARLEVGLEARAGFIVEADCAFGSLGVVLSGDALTF